MSLPSAIGRYEILGELATGGMAEILLGRVTGQGGFERPVVIKRILPHLARQKSFVAMFLDEARIVAQIRHPNVVHVQELGQEGDELYLVMEYLEGESVAGVVKRLRMKQRAVSPSLAAFVLAEACAGLHAAHELVDANGAPLSLVHRDVSPQNVFLTYQGQVKVIDFGVAKAADRITRTEAGQLKGKYEYMSPEQCAGGAVDRRSDVFALGVLLYELGTMRRLFKRFNPMLALKAITEEPILPPSRVSPSFPARLEAICMRALARSPDDRFASAAEMRRELVAFLRETAHEPSDELATVMHDVFADRIEEKRELLRRMRTGSEVTHIPAGEPDTAVDVPSVDVPGVDVPGVDVPSVDVPGVDVPGVDAEGGLTTGTGSSLDTPAVIPRRRTPLAAVVAVIALAVVGVAVVRARSAPPSVAAEPAQAATPVAIATQSATPAESEPLGATASASSGATPTPAPLATGSRPRRVRAPSRTPPPPPPIVPATPASTPPAVAAPAPSKDPAPASSKGFHRFE